MTFQHSERDPLNRSMRTLGSMVKAPTGSHTDNGQLHKIYPKVETAKPNARSETKVKIAHQKHLRMNLDRERDGDDICLILQVKTNSMLF